MQIIYGFSNCTDNLYNQIFAGKQIAVLQPDQKYHGLFIKGLASNGAKIKCLSGLPINRAVTKKLWISKKDEEEEGIKYHYYKTFNIPIIRQLMIFFGAFNNVLKVKKKKQQTFAICDCLNIANAYGFRLACKLKKIPLIMIVTDLPDMIEGKIFIKKINNKLFKKADGFIFLTEQMNGRVNLKNKPYVVLEGHCDKNTIRAEVQCSIERQTGKKVVMYAGKLEKIYGLQNLVEGFIKANIPNCELRIFGDGDYLGQLKEICKTQQNVKYMGVKSNQEIVVEEKKCSLLVNPRPSAPEYTKYSFPSKNMEYMVSGTPLLTTKLPGMPTEYYPYVYLFDDESVEGVAKKIKDVLSLSIDERVSLGEKAREFVLLNKSNDIQAKRFLDFIQGKI